VVDDPALKAEIRRRCEPYDEEGIQSRPEPLRSRLLNLPGLKREKDYLTTCLVLLQTIMPIGHIHHAKLSPAQKEPDFRRKVFRNRYGSPYPFARSGVNPA
jgi:hypothetical protein